MENCKNYFISFFTFCVKVSKKISKSSDVRSWNHTMFDVCLLGKWENRHCWQIKWFCQVQSEDWQFHLFYTNSFCACGATNTWKEAGVASIRVLFAETEGAIVAFRDAAAALVKKLDQSPPSPKIHPELVEEGPIDKVMLVVDWWWRRNKQWKTK